jgi:hypothetical protein
MKSSLNRISTVFVLLALTSCGKPQFSGSSQAPKLKPAADQSAAAEAKQDPKSSLETPIAVGNLDPITDDDINQLCRTLFGVSAGANCKIPTKSLFGGSYQIGQNGAPQLVNAVSKKTECSSGYKSYPVGEMNIATGDTKHFMCWAENSSNSVLTSSRGCPKDQALMMQSAKQVCSDIPVKVCKSFEGNYNFQDGSCILQPFKTVFGGVFQTSRAKNDFPQVTIFNPDDQKSVLEYCKTPNTIGGFSQSCECPKGFAVFSSSGINQNIAGIDNRFNYCFRETSSSLILEASSEPDAGCKNKNETSQVINGTEICSTSASRLCHLVGGSFNTLNSKCVLPQEEFFGGAYQVGEYIKWKDVYKVEQDPIEKRTQYCESPNPFVKKQKDSKDPLGCVCPAGFKAIGFITADENTDRSNFDNEYLCIIDR